MNTTWWILIFCVMILPLIIAWCYRKQMFGTTGVLILILILLMIICYSRREKEGDGVLGSARTLPPGTRWHVLAKTPLGNTTGTIVQDQDSRKTLAIVLETDPPEKFLVVKRKGLMALLGLDKRTIVPIEQ